MAGKHSKRRARARISGQRGSRQAVPNDVRIPGWSRWRRSSAAAVVPGQRCPGIELVDALSKVAHRVSPDELLAGRSRDEYQGVVWCPFPRGEHGRTGSGPLPGVCTMSDPVSAVREAVHLLPADELFRRDYPASTGVAVCGELVTSGPDREEDPHYCGDCVREALRWCARPRVGGCHA
jgi:hypothetical protein